MVPAAALGYLTFRATTHPNSRFRKKMPNIKVKRIQLFPVLRISVFGRTIHFHHWFNFSILLALSGMAPMGFLEGTFARGILLGGIIQGLTLPKGHRGLIYKN